MYSIKVYYTSLITIFYILSCVNTRKYPSINTFYKKGVDSYSGQRWSECIVQFEDTLHLYKIYKSIIRNCRLQCNSQNPHSNNQENIEYLQIFKTLITKRNCVIKCKENGFNDVQLDDNVSDDVLYDLKNRKPYEYLHICYFQMYTLPKAASASYTYLVANPFDSVMVQNLQYYTEQPEVDQNDVTDLEADDYIVLHKMGIKSYNQGNWGETVAAMEEVLNDYILTENNCRAECEQITEQESSESPEFIIMITNNIKTLLKCKQQCQNEVKSLKYESGLHFLADILNYLQISYYHLGRVKDAAKAVESYLLLFPEDEDMIENKKMYITLVDKEYFVYRSDIDYYHKRDSYEKSLLNSFVELEIDNNIYM